MSRATLTASWVVPVDGPPVRDGCVVVEGDHVAWVGPPADPAAPGGPVRDLGPGVLLPGLVNAHCHLELSHLQGVAPFGQGFVPWVEAFVKARPPSEGDDARAAAAAAIASLVDGGTTAVGDVSNRLAHLDLLAKSPLAAVVFLEVLAWEPEKVAQSEAWLDEHLGAAPGSDRMERRPAAHAPHSISPALLRRLVARGGVGSIHLAESPEECRFLLSGDGPWANFLDRRGLGHVPFQPPGTTPVRYADELGLLGPGLVVAHGVHTTAEDREVLARRGVSVALCPRSNRNIGVGEADVPALLDAGVRLCLGTDSLVSAETLDVLDDAALLAERFPELDPAQIVRMATAGGAEALGLADLGALAPGKRAALAFVAADEVPEDPCAYAVSGTARPRRVELG
jgi:cytosine/adenosine deaminase-related metal-dependent hydrolase